MKLYILLYICVYISVLTYADEVPVAPSCSLTPNITVTTASKTWECAAGPIRKAFVDVSITPTRKDDWLTFNCTATIRSLDAKGQESNGSTMKQKISVLVRETNRTWWSLMVQLALKMEARKRTFCEPRFVSCRDTHLIIVSLRFTISSISLEGRERTMRRAAYSSGKT